jgi:hypothetical protein
VSPHISVNSCIFSRILAVLFNVIESGKYAPHPGGGLISAVVNSGEDNMEGEQEKRKYVEEKE